MRFLVNIFRRKKRPDASTKPCQTVFFGANDARLPNEHVSPQHVSLEQYRSNIVEIIQHPTVKAQHPRIILVTPPPIDEYLTEETDREKGFVERRRTADNTRKYADVIKAIGKENGIAVLDIWTSLMVEAGWNGNEPLIGSKQLPQLKQMQLLLHDGEQSRWSGHVHRLMWLLQESILIQAHTKCCT